MYDPQLSPALQIELLERILEIHPSPWTVKRSDVYEVLDAKQKVVVQLAAPQLAADLVKAAKGVIEYRERMDAEVAAATEGTP